MTIFENDLKHAIAGTAAIAKPLPVIGNKILVSKDIKKTVKEYEKHGVNKLAPFFGEEGINGAKDHALRRKPTIKEFFHKNYTPKIMIKRAAQRAALSAVVTGGLEYFDSHNVNQAAKAAAIGAGIGGIVGATIYPAVFYGAGKLSQHIHEKIQNKGKK